MLLLTVQCVIIMVIIYIETVFIITRSRRQYYFNSKASSSPKCCVVKVLLILLLTYLYMFLPIYIIKMKEKQVEETMRLVRTVWSRIQMFKFDRELLVELE